MLWFHHMLLLNGLSVVVIIVIEISLEFPVSMAILLTFNRAKTDDSDARQIIGNCAIYDFYFQLVYASPDTHVCLFFL